MLLSFIIIVSLQPGGWVEPLRNPSSLRVAARRWQFEHHDCRFSARTKGVGTLRAFGREAKLAESRGARNPACPRAGRVPCPGCEDRKDSQRKLFRTWGLAVCGANVEGHSTAS